jgi:hypothetical protein
MLLRFAVLGTLGAAAVGYAFDGVLLALFEGGLFAIVGFGVLAIAPQHRPLSPSIIPPPDLGDSPEAARRRVTVRIMLLSLRLPLVLVGILVAVALPAGPAVYVVIALTAAYVVRLGYVIALTAVRGERFDRQRQRRYERTVARLEADQRVYEAKVDPEREAAKAQRSLRLALFFGVAAAVLLVLLIVFVAVIAVAT